MPAIVKRRQGSDNGYSHVNNNFVMKQLFIIFIFLPLLNFSQYFVPFGEDSLYYASGSACVVKDIFVDDTVLYVGGAGIDSGGTELLYEIGAYYNNDWHSLDNGLGHPSGDIYCIQKYNNNIYIGGGFPDIQNIPQTDNIGRFNGNNWEAVPNTYGDVSSDVWDMVVYDNQLIIGGGGFYYWHNFV